MRLGNECPGQDAEIPEGELTLCSFAVVDMDWDSERKRSRTRG